MAEELVLTFHGIGTSPAGIPAVDLPYWIDRDAFCRILDQAAGIRWPKVVVTFDDGNLSDLETAAPELAERGLAGIFFPCSGRVGQPGYLDAANLQALVAQGFAVGSHGKAHVPWRGMDPPALQTEVVQSRAELAVACGRPVTLAALPFGAYDRRTLAAMRRAGYTAVYSSDPGISRPGSWFRRRWSWVAGRDFDIEALARASRHPRHRLVSSLKHLVKALR